MTQTRDLLHPSIEELVREIKAINHAWKAVSELFGNDSPLSTSSRDLKTCLQVRLLRNYAPTQVYLVCDRIPNSEDLYGIRLRKPIRDWEDADHLPVRVIKEWLTNEEIEQFKKV